MAHLQRIVTFAFGDEIIEEHEYTFFEEEVRRLGIQDPAVEEMRRRLQRGLVLSRIRNGELPRVQSSTLHLDLEASKQARTSGSPVIVKSSGKT